MNTYRAAQKVRTYLIERYALEGEPAINLPRVLTADESADNGFLMGSRTPHVVWESSEGYDWPSRVCDAIYAGKLSLPGVFAEPATGYALSFYKD
jgi:hypothetical protein